MVLPPCPMAESVVPRHSAVMERLRRRIELCRRHHSACESRYQAVSPERLELERQQTFALHQRCLQAKAKRAGKHRQAPLPPPPTAPSQPPPPAPAPGPVGSASTSASSDRSGVNGVEADTAGREQQHQHGRSSALIALHETVKRNLDSSVSSQNGDQQNGYGDMFSVPKKLRHDDSLVGLSGSSNGIPPASPLHQLDNKPSSGDTLQLNGKHSMGLDGINKKCLPDSNLQLNGSNDADDPFAMVINKELKQEPDDLPCMITGPGSSISQNNLMSDLNLNEQEWKELIDELNRSVPDEDMKDLFTEDFEEKKDVDASNSAAQTPLPQDIIIKTEFSPADFEQEQMGSPQVRSTSAGTAFIGTSSIPVTATSPSVSNSQTMIQPSNQSVTENPNQSMMQPSNQTQNVQRPLPSSLLSAQNTGGAKEMSSAKQLQQIAAKQKRDQLLQNQQQIHQPNQISCWQQSGPSHSPLAVPYSMENPTSPSVYQQDFSNQKPMMSSMPNKSSPRAGGNYHSGNILSHQPNNLNQNSVSSQNSVLDYGNTKPLSHYKECGQGVTISGQNKTSMSAYIQQRQQPTLPHMSDEQNGMFAMKKSGNIPYRPLVPHNQDQNPPSGVPRIPVSVPGPGVNAQPPNVSMAGNHGNPAYLNSQQQAAVMKQHQMLLDQQKQREQQKHLLMEQQKHFLMGQRQLLAEQEKQRHHQEQQLQRHLTRPPPQYQDQTQNPYQQQFTGSSPTMAGVNNLGQSNSSSPRIFSQTQNMIQIATGHNSVSSSNNQQDRGVTQYPGLQSIQRGSLYNIASGMTQMVPQHTNPSANGQPQMQRQPSLAPGTAVPAGYGQSTLASTNISQQHNKGALNPNLSKPQMARMPTTIGAQNPSWQHQGMSNMNSQAQGNSGLGTFTANSTFHMQQTHLKLTNQQFGQGMPQVSLNTSRPMTSMNSAVSGQMLSTIGAQQRTNPPTQQVVPSQQILPGMSQAVPDLTSFSQNQNQQLSNRANLHCSQGYPVRTASQELPFVYSNPPGSNGLQTLTGDTDLIDALLKNRTSEEWMNDLDELLGNH
ncbi:mastermind-like protein 1 isoform X2 [Rhineura floridana]|uniref:mastermind-like protein 1 isoform X2 n=1 Tax=Rhineura floridana TaxID=261503 RepID=UPI002AC84135|nr:mastermind-like protein 1 isoform X2 [Rhineura floridana]